MSETPKHPPVPIQRTPSGEVHILIPDVGDDSKVVRIIRFHVKVGDHVTEEQPIADIQYNVATLEIPSPRAGVVQALRLEVDQQVGLFTALLTLAPAD